MRHPRWTISALTIPGREQYLRRLIASLDEVRIPGGARIVVVYNKPIREGLRAVEREIARQSKRHDVEVFFNNGDPTISGGRNFQLNVCKSPLLCFIDDDVTVHGDAFTALEDAMRRVPAGILGMRSYVEDTDTIFKPREATPYLESPELRYMTVQGMLVAGYTNLFRDIGGFNPRRRFWGEWTEFNLRMWRNGYPGGYVMKGGYLRHWEKAPESPTRSLEGRARHVLWGLICTALEYDAVDVNEATETFWQLVEDRYLAYSFGDKLTHRELLRATLELLPELSADWAQISAFRARVGEHPFDFKPFHPITERDVKRVLPYARKRIGAYRSDIWPAQVESPVRKWIGGLLGGGRRRDAERDQGVRTTQESAIDRSTDPAGSAAR